MRRFLTLIMAMVILASLIGCGTNENNNISEEALAYQYYMDIPGVTPEEVGVIEDLQTSRANFSVAMPLSDECFVDGNGELKGYSVLLCEWLTDRKSTRLNSSHT